MAQRVTYRRRLSYNTRSNKIRKVKAPGGRLVAQYISKKAGPVKCGDCGKKLQGLSILKNPSTAPKARKQITRVYGGSRCGKCVKERIIRAFLIEEREIVKYLLKSNKLR